MFAYLLLHRDVLSTKAVKQIFPTLYNPRGMHKNHTVQVTHLMK